MLFCHKWIILQRQNIYNYKFKGWCSNLISVTHILMAWMLEVGHCWTWSLLWDFLSWIITLVYTVSLHCPRECVFLQISVWGLTRTRYSTYLPENDINILIRSVDSGPGFPRSVTIWELLLMWFQKCVKAATLYFQSERKWKQVNGTEKTQWHSIKRLTLVCGFVSFNLDFTFKTLVFPKGFH